MPALKAVTPGQAQDADDQVAALASAGAQVALRCHIGVDWKRRDRAAWGSLRPYLAAAEGCLLPPPLA
jgi:hypothetical protein